MGLISMLTEAWPSQREDIQSYDVALSHCHTIHIKLFIYTSRLFTYQHLSSPVK